MVNFVRATSVVALLMASPMVMEMRAQTPQLPHDPGLIDKLFAGNFEQIGDDNTARLDIEAVLLAFMQMKCSLQLGTSDMAVAATVERHLRYLNTDSVTGNYPSREFMQMGLLGLAGGNLMAVWGFNPNTMALVLQMQKFGCDGARIQTVGRNLVNLLNERSNGRRGRLTTSAIAASAPVPAEWRAVLGEWNGEVQEPAPARTLTLSLKDSLRGGAFINARDGRGDFMFGGGLNVRLAGPGGGTVSFQESTEAVLEGRVSNDGQTIDGRLTLWFWKPQTVSVRLTREISPPPVATAARSSPPTPTAPPASTRMPAAPAPPPQPIGPPMMTVVPSGMMAIQGEWRFTRVGQPGSTIALALRFQPPNSGDPMRPKIEVRDAAGQLVGGGEFATRADRTGSGWFFASGGAGAGNRGTLTLDPSGILRMIVDGSGNTPPVGDYEGHRLTR